MPKKPVPSTDELARMLWPAEAKAGDVPRKRRPLIPDAVTAESLVAMNQVLPARACDSDDAPPVRAPR